MSRRAAILAGAAAAAILLSGGVVASVLDDSPQEARPVQDTTADLNRQNNPPPAANVPAEPAPEASPAPPAPIAITPAADPIPLVVEEKADDDEAEAGEKAEVKAEVGAEPTGTPGRRQRRRAVVVEAVNKITAERMRFAVEVGGRPVMFQRTLIVSARACETSAPDERVEDSIAYLEFNVRPRGVLQAADPRQVFRGWMFASSPGVNSLEHPIYDAWVVGCRA